MTAKIPSASLNEMPVEYSYPDELTMTSRRGLVTTTQHYDSDRGWLNQVESPNGTLNFSHNVFGQMTGMGVVSGGTTRTTNYGYDELSRLKQITSFNGDVWNYGYDEVGNKASLSRPNGVTTTYGYDTLNRLTDLANVKAGTTLSRFNYRLRADGRRDQLNETIAQPDGTSITRAIQYSFDDANRLTAESGTDGSGKNYSKTYTLDEAGNRQKLVSTLDASTTTTNYSYNDLDWMTQQSVIAPSSTTTTNYAYDANGSQTGITAQVGAAAPTYTKQVWDFEGHLTARGATDAQGNWGNARNEYSYDANGLRLSQSTVAQSGVTSAKTSYLWNGDRLLEERDKDGGLLARYEHGQELGPLSMLRPATSTIAAQTRYFIGDGQDSTRQLIDESGAVKDSYFYDSFGVSLDGGQGTSANSFKYTGQQQDESGLYYLRARYYEAGSGRFLSHDPEMGGSDDPVSMHRYLYASAEPVDGADPSGREDLASVLTSMGVRSSLANFAQVSINVGSRFGQAAQIGNLLWDYQQTGTIDWSTVASIGFDFAAPYIFKGAFSSLRWVIGKIKVRPVVGAADELLKSALEDIAGSQEFKSLIERYNSSWARAKGMPEIVDVEKLMEVIRTQVTAYGSGTSKAAVWSKLDPGTDPEVIKLLSSNPTEFWLQLNRDSPNFKKQAMHELMHLGAMIGGQKGGGAGGFWHEMLVTGMSTPENLVKAGAGIGVLGLAAYKTSDSILKQPVISKWVDAQFSNMAQYWYGSED